MSGQQDAGRPQAGTRRAAAMNFDGASDRPSGGSYRGSQQGSTAASPSRSRSGSNTASPSQSRSASTTGPGPFHKGTGKDPAFDPSDPRSSRPALSKTQLIGKLIDLPPEAFKTENNTPFARRPGFNTIGKPIKIQLNVFPVVQVPIEDIYQYAINVSPNPRDSGALVKKVWNSKACQDWIRGTGGKWLYDGSKLAWCNKRIPRDEARISVDLDREAGREQVGRDGVYYLSVKKAAVIRMNMLKAYISQQADWDDHVLSCMNFMDHLMRQHPSETMQMIKRNFYPFNGTDMDLDAMIVVRKGIYSAFRFGETGSGSISRGLNLNVDNTNTAFWRGGMTVAMVAQWICSPAHTRNYDKNMPFGKLAMLLRPVKKVDQKGNVYWEKSDDFKKLRRLRRLKFHVTHRGKETNPKVYTLEAVMFSQEFGEKGADALHVSFIKKERGQVPGKKITIADYFEEKYGGRLGYPDLPIVATKKGGLFPMEVCKLVGFQRYAFKLDPEQTSSMIRLAVTRPEKRRADILNGVKALAWDKDPYFKEYGVRVDSNMLITNARLLANPELVFGGNIRTNPRLAGRWDLRGKRFIEPNRVPLTSWGFIGCGTNDSSTIRLEHLQAFAAEFTRIYKGHGGVVRNNPFVTVYPFSMGYPEMCTNAYQQTGNTFKAAPQLLFFVLPTRNQLVYERLKKNMECRLCMVTQMLQAEHVRKSNAQYHSNVAMKVNAKLGGATTRAVPSDEKKPDYCYFKCPTMIIGLDVTHASPGQEKPSIAGLAMSIDKTATRYCASVQTNGFKAEIVQGVVMHDLFTRLMQYWVNQHRCSPQHVYYFRDGVSEGQFSQVIDYEIKELKRIFRDGGHTPPRFTVIVATKRHHIRFFPQPGNPQTTDKNCNPLPGTLVEHDATHPFHWDFYLASHVAIQGTARPVHYHVIMDEAQCKPDHLQKMIYHQCYQYVRSTSPVSLHPAVYYSHLAAARGRAHEDQAASTRETPSGKAGFPLEKTSTMSGVKPPTEAPLLLPMVSESADKTNVQHLNTTMWFI